MFSIVLTISHLKCVYDEKTSVCNFPNVKNPKSNWILFQTDMIF